MKATGRKLVLLLTLALVLRMAAGAWWQSRLAGEFAFGDSESYWSLGRAIALGEPYRYGAADSAAFRPPGYPALLAPLFWLGGANPSVLWGRMLGAVLGTVAVAGVWWLGRTLFSPRAGWVAGAIAALDPGQIATSVLILAEAPFCPLMLANLILWIAAWRAPSAARAAGWSAAAGLVAGAATLVRPSWLLFLPFSAIVGVVFDPRRSRQLGLATVMAGGLMVAMCPWWIRNTRVLGRPVLTTTQVGASLYDGLNPKADGSSQMDFVGEFLRKESRTPRGEAEPLEIRLDRRLRESAVAWAGMHPAEVARLAGVKFLRMWNLWPNEKSLSAWTIRVAVAATYLPVLLLGVWGAARTIQFGWPYLLCWLPAVYFTLLHMVFVSSIRYRQPAMLGLIVLAAGAVTARQGVWRASPPRASGEGSSPRSR